MTRDEYDLVVIGGGAAGLGAARSAVHRGARTLLVSDGEPGGDCTFHGCVPSKTLIESARRGLPFSTAIQRVRDVVATIAATEDAATLRDEGIHVALARAAFTGQRRISVDGRPITARRFVVATGSRPSVPQIPGLANAGHLTNETIFDLAAPPASLAVLGGGAVGCELAQAFARLGSRVTVIEAADRLLPDQDSQASRVITAVFEAEGIDVRTGATVNHVATHPAGVGLRLTEGSDVVAERLLLAVGRRTDTDGLGLDAAGIRTDDRGHVVTDVRLADARVAYLPMTEMDRALTAGATDGFIKLIAGHRHVLRNLGGGRILGATIVAARAGELIHEPALAMATGMFTGRLAATTHAYPTWSYGVQLTAAQFFMTMGGRTARRLPDAANISRLRDRRTYE